MFRTHFYGQKISDYGRQNGRVDYHALAASFDAVLCNGILGYRDSWDDWEQISGFVDNSEAIEETKAKLEEVEEALEEATESKAQAERDFDDLSEALDNIEELLEQFESFEYEANEVLEKIRWNNYETPSGQTLDPDTLEREIGGLDFWSMREDIENHQSLVEEQKTEAEEAFDTLSETVEELTKTKKELEAELDDLECEDTTEAEYFQYFIISDSGAKILEQEAPSEAVWYNEELDLYVWGVGHWGTSWDYVLTSIPCETYAEEAERLEQEAKAEEERKARAEAMTEEERAEKETEELEELLDLWDNDEPTEADLEEVTPCEPWHTPEDLTPISWDDAILGDVVIGKAEASEYYGITTEGWKGSITRISRGEDGTPDYFEAVGFDNEPREDGIEPNREWIRLEPHFFDLYRKSEGSDR